MESIENEVEFRSKEEITNLISKFYKNFYNEKIKTGTSFSERSFSKRIDVSQPVLNNLRNGHKKEIEAENAIKILKGINKKEFIEPVLKFLLPQARDIFFENTTYNNESKLFLESNEVNTIIDLCTSKTYGHILSLLLTHAKDEDVTIEDIKKISADADILLQGLSEINIIEIIDNKIVKFNKRLISLFENKKIQFSLPKTVSYAEMLLGLAKPHLVERDLEIGYNSVVTGCYTKEEIHEIFQLMAKLREKIEKKGEKKSGKHIKMAWMLSSVLLFDPNDLKMEKDIEDDKEKNNSEVVLQ